MRLAPKVWRYAGAALLLICQPCVKAVGETWTEVRSPHFRIVTDASTGRAREVAHNFEQMRRVFVQRFGREDISAGAPLTVIAARDADTFRMLEPNLWKTAGDHIAGEFHRGWERQFAVIRLDTWGDANQTVIYHEYAHSILHANVHWLPTWLDEGMAEFYGYTHFESGRTLLGYPSLRLRELVRHPLMPVLQMLAANPQSSEYRDDARIQLYYAESWGMVHFMTFGPGMEGGRKLGAFVDLLETGTPQPEAFTKTFGDPAAFDKALGEYVRQFTVKASVLPADTKDDAKTYIERKLSPMESAYEIGCFQTGAHDRANGRKSIEHAIALDAKFAPAHEELGFLNFDEGKDDEAHKEWAEAVSLDPKQPRAAFALLMTGLPAAGQETLPMAQLAQLRSKLQAITDMAPWYAAPRAELAMVERRQGLLQDAYKDAMQAEKLEPNRAGYHLLTGHILLSGRQPAIAARSARFVALRWQGPDHNEAVELLQRVPAELRGSEPMPSLVLPEGSQAVKGTVVSIACPAPGAKGAVRVSFQPDAPTGGSPLELTTSDRFITGFSDTLWWGEDHFSLCHHLAGLPALVAVKPGGELLDLEVRDPFGVDNKPLAVSAHPAGGSSSTTAGQATP